MAYGTNAPFGLRPVSSINGGAWTEKLNTYHIYASPDGQTTYGSNIFCGDPVVWNPTLTQGGTIAVYQPNRTAGTPSTYSALPLLGVFQGCEYTAANGTIVESQYWPANTQVKAGSPIKAFVVDSPDVIFDIQVSTPGDVLSNANFPTVNATGAAYPAFFGRNFALDIGNDNTPNPHVVVNNPTTGNTQTGQSAFYLAACSGQYNATPATGLTYDYQKTIATLPLTAIGYSRNAQNTAAPGLTMATTPYLNVLVMINNHVYGHNVAGTTLS